MLREYFELDALFIILNEKYPQQYSENVNVVLYSKF